MDRALLILLASRVRAWRQALLIVQPETLLRWHRQGFRLFWRRTSQGTQPTARPKVSAETIALIKDMAGANRLWGAERLRGELLKLDIRVANTGAGATRCAPRLQVFTRGGGAGRRGAHDRSAAALNAQQRGADPAWEAAPVARLPHRARADDLHAALCAVCSGPHAAPPPAGVPYSVVYSHEESSNTAPQSNRNALYL
jgi:hypothetical protein